MTIFLILAPFAAFAALMMVTSVKISLAVAAAIGMGVVGWDLFKGRSLKALSLGAAILFAALSAYHMLAAQELNATTVRLVVDTTVLAIALVSIAIRKPFTLQYAREAVDVTTVDEQIFVRTNYILTWVWSAAFVLMLIADIVSIYLPSMPLWACAAIAFAARNSAVYFTQWYPNHVRTAAAASAAPATV